MAAAPHNVEFEAAKFLQKLIHESTDEPAKLATKLYVILQHMKASGKENSMPYQVISRAMETVINQHGLDVEALMASRIPPSGGSHTGEAGRAASSAGYSQSLGAPSDTKAVLTNNDAGGTDGFESTRLSAGPSNVGHEPLHGSVSQRDSRSFDHESPSSVETRSTNSQAHDRGETSVWEHQAGQKDPLRASIKRKRPDLSLAEPHTDVIQQQLDRQSGVADSRNERLPCSVNLPGIVSGSESSASRSPLDSDYWKQGLWNSSMANRAVASHLVAINQGEIPKGNANPASHLDATHHPRHVDRVPQGVNLSNVGEAGMLRSAAHRDMGKFPAMSVPTNVPFKEHQLKQLRAQCLVFLAFRNGLPPKRLHLEIALGNILPKEGTSVSLDGAHTEPIMDKGKLQTTLEFSSSAEVNLPQGLMTNERIMSGSVASGRVSATDSVSNETDSARMLVENTVPSAVPSLVDEEAFRHSTSGRGTQDIEIIRQDSSNPSTLATLLQPEALVVKNSALYSQDEGSQPGSGAGNHNASMVGMNKQMKPEMISWNGVGYNNPSRGALPVSNQHDLGSRKDGPPSLSQHENSTQFHQRSDNQLTASWKQTQGMDAEQQRVMPGHDTSMLLNNVSHEYEEEGVSISSGMPCSPNYTLSEKWIAVHQRRKLVNEQKWVHKRQKADQRISACFTDLKETVSSSEDISAKTRSIIELKKLQLLELQRRLRRNILNDFFKPIQTEMDRLKSIKKHRIGRRMKHVEKYEQKMKEERQKRIRERQKEFFSEIDIHKERLEDVFKFKRERCKGFNRYVKEFHKRKERLHREKIDRIQREKINLLKINDVEGYLRMVQDAKSDRVKQLLKETEKYLQKLGAKLKEAKATAHQAELDDNRMATVDESSEIATEAEDEKDQAKHYKESNEKYYLIAHSIKENVTEQPSGLQGGKLREYQMNGLRWLVSLYNNHLNGILADEMGLGKTVQVISLICYLMETKNDRGPFLVVVPSSVLPGWEREMNFWAPGISKIVYAGPPEERRKLFKESIIHQKFNVLLTTYEYLMNKHDRPKLSKIHWHYVIIDEGHRIKNASCKLNADLKHYHSSHRLLLTGTPLQNNLEELWALLNFLLPNIFNSSEDFSQWFNKPFEGNGDNSPDEALLSEEENLLIINRLHQVLRPFVLRRLKHKVENELPEKIERLVRCEASAYQKLLIRRVEGNLGALGMFKGRAVHNTVMELRNICNHPYLSQLHTEEVESFIPKHFLPPLISLCGKLEMLDRLLPKLKATNHRVLFFCTMTRLLDIMEDYLVWKQYRYLRLDGHTSGQDRGALIEQFNQPDSHYFIFLLSLRAGGVGVNLQAADTVIIFDTDWNPQVDLQAQARAHRIGQKKDVLVLRLETVNTVEEQVRAAAEHKLGVANQSITAGFFDNNTSAQDRREYLESLLRECKKEEAAPVLDDDGLNDILARSESEIDVFEAIDQERREAEMAKWKKLSLEQGGDDSEVLPLPPRLVTDDDLKAFDEAMKVYDNPDSEATLSGGLKRKSGYVGGLDSQHYGRGKRAREVRSYEEQWTEEEFEKLCQVDSTDSAKGKEEHMDVFMKSSSSQLANKAEQPPQMLQTLPSPLESASVVKKEDTAQVKRGRGRPRRTAMDASSAVLSSSSGDKTSEKLERTIESSVIPVGTATSKDTAEIKHDNHVINASHQVSSLPPSDCGVPSTPGSSSMPKRRGRKPVEKNMHEQTGTETVRRRGRKPSRIAAMSSGDTAQDVKPDNQPLKLPSSDASIANASASSQVSTNSAADSSVGLVMKSDVLAGVTCNPLEPALAKHPASDTTYGSLTDTEPLKSDVLPHGPVSPVHKPALVAAAVKIQESKLSEQSVEPIPLGSSSVRVSPSTFSTDIRTALPQTANINSESANVVSPALQPGKSGTKPARRRGRKQALAISNVLSPSITQVPGSAEPLKTNVEAGVPGVAYSPAPASCSVTVPETLVTVTSPAISTATQISSLHSVVPGVPSQILELPSMEARGQKGKVGELVPRRRGRKKGSALSSSNDNLGGRDSISKQPLGKVEDIIERKGIATRSRQINVSQSKNLLEEFSQEKAKELTSLTSPAIEGSGAVKVIEVGKVVEVKQVNLTENNKVCFNPAHLPPVSSAGKTNVIVLALEWTTDAMDYEKDGSELYKDDYSAGRVCTSRQEAFKSQINSVGTGSAQLEEELCAPPGFDTPRISLADTTDAKPPEYALNQTSKPPDANISTVVLALESAALDVDTGSMTFQSECDEEGISQSLNLEGSLQAGVASSKLDSFNPVSGSSADRVRIGPPEDEMSAPPGFDIPQQSLTDAGSSMLLNHTDVGVQVPSIATDLSQTSRFPEVGVSGANGSDGSMGKSCGHNHESSVPPGFETSKTSFLDQPNNTVKKGADCQNDGKFVVSEKHNESVSSQKETFEAGQATNFLATETIEQVEQRPRSAEDEMEVEESTTVMAVTSQPFVSACCVGSITVSEHQDEQIPRSADDEMEVEESTLALGAQKETDDFVPVGITSQSSACSGRSTTDSEHQVEKTSTVAMKPLAELEEQIERSVSTEDEMAAVIVQPIVSKDISAPAIILANKVPELTKQVEESTGFLNAELKETSDVDSEHQIGNNPGIIPFYLECSGSKLEDQTCEDRRPLVLSTMDDLTESHLQDAKTEDEEQTCEERSLLVLPTMDDLTKSHLQDAKTEDAGGDDDLKGDPSEQVLVDVIDVSVTPEPQASVTGNWKLKDERCSETLQVIQPGKPVMKTDVAEEIEPGDDYSKPKYAVESKETVEDMNCAESNMEDNSNLGLPHVLDFSEQNEKFTNVAEISQIDGRSPPGTREAVQLSDQVEVISGVKALGWNDNSCSALRESPEPRDLIGSYENVRIVDQIDGTSDTHLLAESQDAGEEIADAVEAASATTNNVSITVVQSTEQTEVIADATANEVSMTNTEQTEVIADGTANEVSMTNTEQTEIIADATENKVSMTNTEQTEVIADATENKVSMTNTEQTEVIADATANEDSMTNSVLQSTGKDELIDDAIPNEMSMANSLLQSSKTPEINVDVTTNMVSMIDSVVQSTEKADVDVGAEPHDLSVVDCEGQSTEQAR